MTRTYLTTLVPIEAGREEALRKTLADLPTGRASPFQRVAGTHMARLCVLDHEVAANFAVVANHDTVDAVRNGLDLRARLGQFAARLQGAAPAAVRAAYREGFDR